MEVLCDVQLVHMLVVFLGASYAQEACEGILKAQRDIS
jgi:hypothetical protein